MPIGQQNIMKRFIIFLLLVFPLFSFAQNENEALPLPDSLVGRLKENRKANVARAEALDAAIMFYYDEHRILEAESYINEMSSMANDLKDSYWKALSLYYRSLCAYERYSFSECFPYIKESLQVTETLKETKRTQLLLTRIYLAQSGYYYKIHQFPECQSCIEKGLNLAENNGFDKLLHSFQNNYAALLIGMNRFEDATVQLKKLLIDNTDSHVLLNIASAFQQMKQYDSAFFFIDSILRYASLSNQKETVLQEQLIKANQIKAVCHLDLEQWDNAILCLNKSRDLLEKYDDKELLGVYYLHKADANNGKGQYETSLGLIDTALFIAKEIKEVDLEWQAVKLKSDILENLKEYEKEVENLRYFNVLTDTLNNRHNLLKMQENQYQHEAQALEQQYELQRLASRNRQLIIIILALLFVIIAVLTAVIIWINRKRLKAELELRNREITAKSIGKIQSNEVINGVIEKLSEWEQHPKKNMLPGIIHDLKTLVDDDTKKDFDQYFVKVHPEFYQKLMADFPNLTQNELRLCAYLKMNLNTKDIAAICNITPESARVARSRLRKSLNLVDSSVDLVSFLSKY